MFLATGVANSITSPSLTAAPVVFSAVVMMLKGLKVVCVFVC